MHGEEAIFKKSHATNKPKPKIFSMHDDKRNPTIDKNNPTFLYRLADSIKLSS